jgi:hypothetical protein
MGENMLRMGMAERQGHLKQTVRDRPELVDCEWMSAALASAGVLGDARIEAMEFTPVGYGMMSDCFRFELSYPDPKARGPRTVIGKFPAADPTSRSTGVSLLIYLSEVRFYQVLASRIWTRTPHVYLAEIDRQTGAFTVRTHQDIKYWHKVSGVIAGTSAGSIIVDQHSPACHCRFPLRCGLSAQKGPIAFL